MWPIVSQHTFDTLTQRRNLGLWSIFDLLRAATAFAGLATCTAHLSLAFLRRHVADVCRETCCPLELSCRGRRGRRVVDGELLTVVFE